MGAFFAGAVIASVIIESGAFASKPRAYGSALALQAALLLALLLPEWLPIARPTHTIEAALVCSSMGMQNSLVTRLSGAVVRTTHLTGVVTDIGIEVARWLRWGRVQVARRVGVRLALRSAERPEGARIRLLSVIASTFSVGAVAGAWLTMHFRYRALSVPVASVTLAALSAFAGSRTRPS